MTLTDALATIRREFHFTNEDIEALIPRVGYMLEECAADDEVGERALLILNDLLKDL
jgi:hypothetical protein